MSVQQLCRGVFPLLIQVGRQIVPGRGHTPAPFAFGPKQDIERLTIERLGIGETGLAVEIAGQIVQGDGRVHMVLALNFPMDLQGQFIEGLRLGVFVLRIQTHGQIAARFGRCGMLVADQPPDYRQHLSKQFLCLGVPGGPVQKLRVLISGHGDELVLRAQDVLVDFQVPLRQGQRFSVLPLFRQIHHFDVNLIGRGELGPGLLGLGGDLFQGREVAPRIAGLKVFSPFFLDQQGNLLSNRLLGFDELPLPAEIIRLCIQFADGIPAHLGEGGGLDPLEQTEDEQPQTKSPDGGPSLAGRLSFRLRAYDSLLGWSDLFIRQANRIGGRSHGSLTFAPLNCKPLKDFAAFTRSPRRRNDLKRQGASAAQAQMRRRALRTAKEARGQNAQHNRTMRRWPIASGAIVTDACRRESQDSANGIDQGFAPSWNAVRRVRRQVTRMTSLRQEKEWQ